MWPQAVSLDGTCVWEHRLASAAQWVRQNKGEEHAKQTLPARCQHCAEYPQGFSSSSQQPHEVGMADSTHSANEEIEGGICHKEALQSHSAAGTGAGVPAPRPHTAPRRVHLPIPTVHAQTEAQEAGPQQPSGSPGRPRPRASLPDSE